MPPLTQAPAQPQQKSKKTREKLRVLFEFFDEDGSGAIDRVELMNIMRSVGHAPTEEYIDAIMAQADVNQDGKIDFEEFVNIMTSQLAANPNEFIAQEVVQSLRIFDRDLSGFVSVEDFKQAMMTLGEKLPESEVDEMIAMCEVTPDGYIPYEAFVTAVQNAADTVNFLDGLESS
eukprot:m.69325 g.69325  ORF g.69325 m.69325 type:complete len:175 (-) comp12222_c0_seq8:4216-4740(-)